MSALIFILFVTVFCGAIVARVFYDWNSRKKLAAALRDDRTVMLLPSPTNIVHVRSMPTNDRPRAIEARAARGRSGPTVKWFVTGELPRLAARTSLLLERKGLAEHIGDLVGIHDVLSNDQAIDGEVRIRGSTQDVVRGIVCRREVIAALRAFFLERQGLSFDLSLDGRFTMCVARGGLAVEDVRATMDAAAALLDVLEEHADAPPLADPGSLGGGVGPDSGTPFVVPLGDRR